MSQEYGTNDSTGTQISSEATASSIDQTKNSNSKNETELYNFRTSNWGDSKEDVLNHEKETQLKQTGPSLTGNVMVYGLDSFVTYNFNSDQLVRGIYMFYLDYSDTKEYISKYDELKNTVSQLYGDPIYVNENATDEELSAAKENIKTQLLDLEAKAPEIYNEAKKQKLWDKKN